MKKRGVLLAVFAVFIVAALALYFHNTAIGRVIEGDLLCKEGKFEEAIAAYDKAIELNPKSASAYNNKGVALDNLGRHEEEIVAYDKAIGANPKDAIELDSKYVRAYLNKGDAMYALGKYEEAIAAYDRAIELAPKDGLAYNLKGYVLIEMARYDDAIKCLNKSLELKPNDRTVQTNMALLFQRRNRPGDAVKARVMLTNLLIKNDRDKNAARAYAMLGMRDKMLPLVRKFVAEKPILKRVFRNELAFEAYRDDPKFKAIVGG